MEKGFPGARWIKLLGPKFQFSTLAFLHSLVTTFPALCTSLSSYSLTTISMTTITSQWSNNIYCRQHDYSSPAHQLQYSVQLLYHHLADPLDDLQGHIELDHHLNDNHQPQIALLASSASIELESSSARVTSTKFQKGLGRLTCFLKASAVWLPEQLFHKRENKILNSLKCNFDHRRLPLIDP